MQVETIYSVELSRLTNICPEINEQFLTEVLKQVPEMGKETDRYYLLNNNLTLNTNNTFHIDIYNLLLQTSQQKGQILQLIKK